MSGVFVSLLNLVNDIFSSILTLAGDIIAYLFEALITSVFTIIEGLFGGFDTSTIVGAMNAIPPQVYDLAYRVGLKEVSAIVMTALTIKFCLQLIPFVRIGSK